MRAGKLRDLFSSVWRQQEKIILSRMKTVCVLSFFFFFNSSSKLKKSLVQIKWRFPYIFFQPLSKGSVQILLNKSERMLKHTSINSRKKKKNQRQNCFISVTVKRFTLMSFCHLPQNWLWTGPLISGQVIQVYCRKQKKSVVSLFFQCLRLSLFPSLWFWRTSGGLTWQKGWSHAPAPPKNGEQSEWKVREHFNLACCCQLASCLVRGLEEQCSTACSGLHGICEWRSPICTHAHPSAFVCCPFGWAIGWLLFQEHYLPASKGMKSGGHHLFCTLTIIP